jgi:hypothetical protein
MVYAPGVIVTDVGRHYAKKNQRSGTVVEIKVDKDKFDQRVEKIMNETICKEMTSLSSQSPRDVIVSIWILANCGGKMERNRLRASTGKR